MVYPLVETITSIFSYGGKPVALVDRPTFCTIEHLSYLFQIFGRIGLNRQIGRFYLLKQFPKLTMNQANEIINFYLSTYAGVPVTNHRSG
jgi:hypothetical protein